MLLRILTIKKINLCVCVVQKLDNRKLNNKTNNQKDNINNNQNNSIEPGGAELEQGQKQVGEEEADPQANGQGQCHHVEIQGDAMFSPRLEELDCEGKSNS